MPRLPRYVLTGHPQHVIQRGNNRCPIFVAKEDYLRFRDDLAEACSRHRCQIHAYVFMTNHVHFKVPKSGVEEMDVGQRRAGVVFIKELSRATT